MEDQPTQRLNPADLPDSDTIQWEDVGPVPTPPPRRRRVRHASPPPPTCVKCGSVDPPIDVDLLAERALTARRADVLIGWLGGSSSVRALACPACGHLDLYVNDLARLKS